jgi:hypothetical protein
MTATSVTLNGNFSAGGNLDIGGQGHFTDIVTVGDDLDVSGNTFISGNLTGAAATSPVGLGSGGIRFSDGTVQTTAGTGTFTTSQIASETVLGVIRVGQYLAINPETGVLRVDPPDQWTYTLPAATTSTLGGIKVGYGLAIDGSGILNVTSSTFTNTQATNVSLASDLITNGYSIRSGVGQTSYLNVSNGSIGASTTGTVNIAVTSSTSYIKFLNSGGTTSTSVEINTGTINLKTPIVVAGANVYNSTLLVGRIYNYEGTSAPFFPAGVQYQDNTIQRTAWRGYDQGLI